MSSSAAVRRIEKLCNDWEERYGDNGAAFIGRIRVIIEEEMSAHPAIGHLFETKDSREAGRVVRVTGWDDGRRKYIAFSGTKETYLSSNTLKEKWRQIE